MNSRRRLVSALRSGAALVLPLVTILFVVWPNIAGRAGLGPETIFDLTDPLFGNSLSPPPGPHDDPSPVVVDWPRDRRLLARARAGHFDLWNPTIGNGVPLAPDPGGVLSPLRLVLYAAPVEPYTAFVLFRVIRLLVAAVGTYLCARVYGLSRPAGALAGVAFGLSGGMVSQVPFAEVASVCWLPWMCWAQARLARRGTATAILPLAFTVAATLTGGHQPIVGGVMLGAVAHALGVVVVQATWRARARTAGQVAAGYLIGGLLAAPALLPFAELLANGHTYKTSMGENFRRAFNDLGLQWLFVDAIVPHTLGRLRAVAATNYPYVLNFACGVLAYLLACVALVRRRWPLEWMLLLLLGIGICFTPPGFGWIARVPLLKDIVPRYLWALFMLPVIVAAAFGMDALTAGVRARRWRDRRRAPGPATGGPAWTIAGGVVVFALAAAGMARVLWKGYPGARDAFVATLAPNRAVTLETVAPVIAAVVLFLLAAALLRWRRDQAGGWLLVAAACVEAAIVATPHLREPRSWNIRSAPSPEVPVLAQRIAAAHGRVGGTAGLIPGWAGWPELRSITPLAPRRYARFLSVAAGTQSWTYFGLPGNRSALADLAGVDTLIVPLTPDRHLEGDPQVVHVEDIRAVSIFRNEGALPRARVVYSTIPAATTDDAVARLGQHTAGAAHVAGTPLATAVILEPNNEGAPAPQLTRGVPATPATFLADEPDRVIVEVEATHPGYLVLADTHYPGWRATVDDQPRPIHPANVGFRAVAVPAGKHRVAFHFRPTSFWAGVALAGVGLAACLALAWVGTLRARRRQLMAAAAPVAPATLRPMAT